jgi:4-amino-4-deoxy-L-arabinose transferase-like glycosyltransferase
MSKTIRYSFYFIVLASLAAKLVFVAHKSLWPDEALYLHISRNLISGPLVPKNINGSLFYQNPPLFMYILSFPLRMRSVDPTLLAHLLTILMDTGTVILTFLIAKKLYGSKVGLVSAALLSVNPLHYCMSARVLVDVPLTFFVYLALLLLINQKKVMFYLFSFLALATKYPAAPLFFVPLFNENRLKRSPRVWFSIYLLAILAAVLIVTHPFQTHHKWMNYFISFIKAPDFSEMYHETNFFLGPVVSLFFLIGLFVALKNQEFSPLLVWTILFGSARMFLPWMAFRFCRYTLPLYPAATIFAAYGGMTIFRLFKEKLPAKTRLWSTVSCLILLYVLTISPYRGYTTAYRTNNKGVGFDDARVFFNQRAKSAAVLTSSPRQLKYLVPKLAVYDLPPHFTPRETSLLIKENGIDFVMLDRWSPHQPQWVLEYFLPKNGYHPVFQTRNLIIFEVDNRADIEYNTELRRDEQPDENT